MLPFLWNLLNISSYLLFGFVCFRAARLLHQQGSTWAAALLVLGLLALLQGANQGQKRQPFAAATYRTSARAPESVTLETFGGSTLKLYSQAASEGPRAKPASSEAFASLSGLVIGYRWTTEMIRLDQLPKASVSTYQVTGTLDWTLLGLTIYRQPKQWSGRLAF